MNLPNFTFGTQKNLNGFKHPNGTDLEILNHGLSANRPDIRIEYNPAKPSTVTLTQQGHFGFLSVHSWIIASPKFEISRSSSHFSRRSAGAFRNTHTPYATLIRDSSSLVPHIESFIFSISANVYFLYFCELIELGEDRLDFIVHTHFSTLKYFIRV